MCVFGDAADECQRFSASVELSIAPSTCVGGKKQSHNETQRSVLRSWSHKRTHLSYVLAPQYTKTYRNRPLELPEGFGHGFVWSEIFVCGFRFSLLS